MTYDGEGPGPEGIAILADLTNDLGSLLWRTLRSVILWADSEPTFRKGLFPEDLADRRQLEILALVPGDDTHLRSALEDLLAVVARPTTADPQFAGIACHRIAVWAEQRGMRRTQLEYLQAAAACCPANAGFALAVGRICRELAQYGRAEAWFYRAVGLARQSGDWDSYIRSYLGHGHMMMSRGVLPSARRSFLKGLRRARRQGLRDVEGRALHYLFTLEFRGGRVAKAMEYAKAAVAAYGPSHDRLPQLAHDVAFAWVELGDGEHALPIFLEALGRVLPVERPVVLGSLARAAALDGDAQAYEWAKSQLAGYGAEPSIAEAWVEVARAALTLGRLEEAEEAAALAESVARFRREGQVRFMAEAVMEEARAAKDRVLEVAGAEATAEDVEVRDVLARDIIRMLRAESPQGAVALV